MCRDRCNRCNECNPCDNDCRKVECGCKFEVDSACVRYTKGNLPCIGKPEGTPLEDIIEAIGERLCETGCDCEDSQVVVEAGENVTVGTREEDGVTTYTVNSECCCNNLYLSLDPVESEVEGIYMPEIVVTGGTAPYTYKWTLQQTGGTNAIITNPTADNFQDVFASTGLMNPCNGPTSLFPCRVAYVNEVNTDPTHAWHYKLEVTDSKGCKVKDYWTVYTAYYF